jgi:hypothetical protein
MPRSGSTNQRARVLPTKGSEAKGRAYASQMPVQGEKALYKVQSSEEEEEGQKITPKTQPQGAGSRAAGHLICNQTPAYIRGSGPLA